MKKIFTNILTKLAMVAVLAGIATVTALGADVTDVINNAATSSNLGNTATSSWGTNFTITGTSGAKYYIHSMGTKSTTNALQWNSNGFLYMTESPSGYKLKSVTITTTANKNIGVYAQNSAYSATPSGNALNTLAATSSGATYSFTSDYSYIALKGTASSTSITSISIVWEEVASSAVATTTTISASGITNTDVYVSTTAGSLSATVKDANNNTVSGASVTWSGNNDAVATINASTGAVTLVSAGSVTFTATYDGKSGEYLGSSTTYDMTVTSSAPYVQPTEITITPNYTFWGESAQFSGDAKDNLSGSKDNVSLEWSRGNGSTYANTTAMRFYKDNTLTFTAPTGYEIKSIDLTVSGTYSDLAFSPSGWDNENTKWTGSSETVTMSRPSNATSYATISSITITLGQPSSVTAPTFSPAGGTSFGNEGLDVTISAANGTIHYTLDGSNPTTSSSVYSSAIHITSTTTIKAIAADGTDISDVASATYTYVDPNRPGTQNNPYTVSQARAAIDAGSEVDGVYATGIVSEIVTAYNSQYGNISYNISVDGSTSTDQLQAYRGKSYNGVDFTSADDIKVGDVVVVYGDLIKYGSTYEFAADNQLVSLDRPVHPIISASNVTIEHDATSGEIAYTVDNPSTGVTLGATTTADWISDIVVTAEKVTFTTTANEGDADRTATFTLTYTGADNKTVTVTQKHFVIDFATLPFEWAGGTSTNLLKENGVSVYGNGSDYGDNHSPYYVKLDGTGDYIQVKTDGRPGIVTVGVKMIGGASTSKITVQGSADGVTFTDVEELTISGAQNDVLTLETSNDFASTDRYVRLYFTKGSNVGVGPITIAAYVAPSTDPSITVTPDTATPAANDVTGTLDISYANLVINDMTDFAVQFCDAQGNELASGSEPSWITALVAEQDPSIGTGYVLSYDMDANTGAERTAYFKVFALGANDYVYSNLVTITQAAYVIDYATLPFEFDGGKADIATTNGLTMSGLGSDYSSGPKLKFDGSGDWLQLEFNEIPGTLTFDIKGNGSGSDPWGGTFKVQTSTDGESYTDLATYTELSNTVSEKEFDIASSVRFIKWVYIEKVTGNVALGNIKLTAKSAADSYIIEGALNNGQYWASFFCSLAGYTISEGAKAFTMNASNQLYLLGEGNVIPANTAVIIISDTDTITLTKTDNASAEVSGGANILVGSDSDTAASGITGIPYVLSIVNNALGFYKFTGTIPANKAYYIVNE